MKRSITLSIIFCGAFLFFSYYKSSVMSDSIAMISSCFLYPVLRVQQFIVQPIYCWLSQRKSYADLLGEYELLRAEHGKLLAETIALKGSGCYEQSIRELLQFKKRYNRKNEYIVQVMARHLSDNTQFFLVNAGYSQGIEKDMIALCGNCLIGKVVEVYPWYCKICLITDNECKIAALCSKTFASGIHEGINRADRTLLRYVSHLEKIVLDDVLLSSGEGLIFPNGFGLGTIVSIEKGELFYTIEVKPLLDFALIRYCTLLKKEIIEHGAAL